MRKTRLDRLRCMPRLLMDMENAWNFLLIRVRLVFGAPETREKNISAERNFPLTACVILGADINQKNVYEYTPLNYADSNSRGHSPIYNTPQEFVVRPNPRTVLFVDEVYVFFFLFSDDD